MRDLVKVIDEMLDIIPKNNKLKKDLLYNRINVELSSPEMMPFLWNSVHETLWTNLSNNIDKNWQLEVFSIFSTKTIQEIKVLLKSQKEKENGISKREFDKKYIGRGLVVNCSTEQEAEEFLAVADSFGYKWRGGESYLQYNGWEEWESSTCYKLCNGTSSDIQYFEPNHNIVYYKKINITKNEFDEDYVGENIVVYCETKQSSIEFLELADEFGYTWVDNTRYPLIDCLIDNICYCLYDGEGYDMEYCEKCEFDIVYY